jgi:beta-1,4-mannooligosaccharide phosphorylase
MSDFKLHRLGQLMEPEAGDSTGVERLGIALEPAAYHERRSDGTGGCEDPRLTFFEPHQKYVMTYTAHSSRGPRIAMAVEGRPRQSLPTQASYAEWMQDVWSRADPDVAVPVRILNEPL